MKVDLPAYGSDTINNVLDGYKGDDAAPPCHGPSFVPALARRYGEEDRDAGKRIDYNKELDNEDD